MSSPIDPARDLLFGLLALQNGLIDQGQLVAAFQAWTRDKARPLADHLADRGDLDPDDRAAIAALAARHLTRHGGDPGVSLAALGAGRSTRERLAGLGDPDVEASLARVDSGPVGGADLDADRTAIHSVGTAAGDGQRFRVLRPHARGGLGAVFVALDGELHREVALKQILEQHADDPECRRRFLAEAEITGGLEHPGIVPVYGLGTDADGRPYYAMRFIRGDSLREAVKRFHADEGLRHDPGRRSLEVRKLLRRFLDVCNAIEYAHSRGVLHRDIKPGNVIVGRHGETLVVDWGLAKPIGRQGPDPPADERTLRPSPPRGSAETLAGTALGTPAYMSPEQAAGGPDQLGPRSDVYSLGATLYCLLTGQAPFQGGDLDVLLDQVARGAFPPPRRIDPTIDRALEAVCLKAMALSPDARYATPRALADDVERWTADEPVSAWREPRTRAVARWLSRHRTGLTGAAALALAGLVGLTAVAAVQARANHALGAANLALTAQRTRAERREAQAIDAVKRFRDAVTENPELKNNPALEGLRKRLLREPLAFFRTLRDGLQADRDTRPESLSRLASASFDLARLTNQIGDERDALKAYEETLAIYERLAREKPDVADYRENLARCHTNIGNLLDDTGQVGAGLESYRKAAAIFERLAREDPAVAAYRSSLAQCHNNIALVLRDTGRSGEALESYRKAVAIFERLAREDPGAAEFQYGLARCHNNLGVVLRDTGRSGEASESQRKAVAIYERLARENPDVAAYRSGLADSYNSFGNLLHSTRRSDAALESYHKAVAIYQGLAREDPAVTEYRSELARSQNNIGVVLHDTGRPGAALESAGKAVAIYERLARENPAVAGYRSGLGDGYHNIGNLLLATGRPGAALESYRKALAIYERLARENPAVSKYRNAAAGSHYNLGVLLYESGELTGAEAESREALALYQDLSRDDPNVPDYQGGHALTLGLVGRLARKNGRPAEAVDAFRRAASILERLAPTAVSLYDLACARALLAGAAVEPASGVSAEGTRDESDEAMRRLRRAVEAGFRDVGQMGKDPDLDALRGRDDFRLLMMDLAMPAEPFAR